MIEIKCDPLQMCVCVWVAVLRSKSIPNTAERFQPRLFEGQEGEEIYSRPFTRTTTIPSSTPALPVTVVGGRERTAHHRLAGLRKGRN